MSCKGVVGVVLVVSMASFSPMAFSNWLKDKLEQLPDITKSIPLPGNWKSGVPIQVAKDAKFPEVAKLKKIAVANFSGQDGAGFTAALRDELSSATINDSKVFSISGTLGVDGRADVGSMVAAAKRQGLDAVYFGQTNVTNSRSTPWTEEVCTDFSTSKMKCKEKRNSSCWNIEGSYVANVFVVRVKDGMTIYEETKSETSKQKHCTAYTKAAPDARKLAGEAKNTIVEAVRDEIIPRTEEYRVKLMSKTRGMSKEDASKFKGASKYAKAGRFDRACGAWEELTEASEANAKHVSLIYNLGVCSEYQGDYSNALAKYRQADGISMSPVKMVSEAIVRTESALSATGR